MKVSSSYVVVYSAHVGLMPRLPTAFSATSVQYAFLGIRRQRTSMSANELAQAALNIPHIPEGIGVIRDWAPILVVVYVQRFGKIG